MHEKKTVHRGLIGREHHSGTRVRSTTQISDKQTPLFQASHGEKQRVRH